MVQGAVVKKAVAKVGTVLLGSAAMVAVDKIDTMVNTPEKKAELEAAKKQKEALKKQKKEVKETLKNMKKVQKIQLQKAKLDAELAAIASTTPMGQEVKDDPNEDKTWLQEQFLDEDDFFIDEEDVTAVSD